VRQVGVGLRPPTFQARLLGTLTRATNQSSGSFTVRTESLNLPDLDIRPAFAYQKSIIG
jgi:hypothetical protein